ncbi:MAG: hypothetical protein ACR2OV_00290 [Hyphomicrobiaceae bacterium]
MGDELAKALTESRESELLALRNNEDLRETIARLRKRKAVLVEALRDAREELQWHALQATGESYNNPKINAALADKEG